MQGEFSVIVGAEQQVVAQILSFLLVDYTRYSSFRWRQKKTESRWTKREAEEFEPVVGDDIE